MFKYFLCYFFVSTSGIMRATIYPSKCHYHPLSISRDNLSVETALLGGYLEWILYYN